MIVALSTVIAMVLPQVADFLVADTYLGVALESTRDLLLEMQVRAKGGRKYATLNTSTVLSAFFFEQCTDCCFNMTRYLAG